MWKVEIRTSDHQFSGLSEIAQETVLQREILKNIRAEERMKKLLKTLKRRNG
jgi:hypothetical protein